MQFVANGILSVELIKGLWVSALNAFFVCCPIKNNRPLLSKPSAVVMPLMPLSANQTLVCFRQAYLMSELIKGLWVFAITAVFASDIDAFELYFRTVPDLS